MHATVPVRSCRPCARTQLGRIVLLLSETEPPVHLFTGSRLVHWLAASIIHQSTHLYDLIVAGTATNQSVNPLVELTVCQGLRGS